MLNQAKNSKSVHSPLTAQVSVIALEMLCTQLNSSFMINLGASVGKQNINFIFNLVHVIFGVFNFSAFILGGFVYICMTQAMQSNINHILTLHIEQYYFTPSFNSTIK
jgi:hypothetical protein